jgi:Flp pilus assembly pilin Flp
VLTKGDVMAEYNLLYILIAVLIVLAIVYLVRRL